MDNEQLIEDCKRMAADCPLVFYPHPVTGELCGFNAAHVISYATIVDRITALWEQYGGESHEASASDARGDHQGP